MILTPDLTMELPSAFKYQIKNIMRLLIVEDHIAFLEGIEEYLTKNLGKDWTIESASTGNGALHKFNSGDAFDILLTDLNLPGLNGSKLVDQLKKRYPSLKVIILTMYYSRAIVTRLKALEISAFLTKNVPSSMLFISIF